LRPNVKAVTFAATDTMERLSSSGRTNCTGGSEKRQRLRKEEQNEG